MTVCVRAGFDKVLPAQSMECADKTGRHGRVRARRFPWRVRAAFMTVPDGSRVQCGDWRRQPRLLVRFRAGILRASLMRPQSAGFRNGVRRASGAPDAGSSSSHAVGAPVNTPSRARDGAAHPPSSGRSSLSRRVRLLPSPPGDGRRCIPRIRGADPGYSVESRSETLGVAPRVLPSETGDRGGAGRCVPSHPRGGRASPSHHDRQPWCDAGPGAPGPPRTIRMDGGIRRFGDARPTARWCNGSTPAPVAGGPGSNPEAGADAHTIRSPTIP